MHKPIREHIPLAFKPAFPGLRGVDIMAHRYGIEPFLVLTEFHMDQPVFGPHPHAGISVMTYMLPDSAGSFLNRDSQGDRSVIEPGGAHVTQAGSGIHHDEVPTVPGVDCHGFQIWIDHAAQDRMVAPRAMHAYAKDIPEVRTAQHLVRVVAGSFDGHRSPFELVTPVTLLHVRLHANAMITLPAEAMAFVYVLSGVGQTLDKPLLPQTLVTFAAGGDTVNVSAGAEGVAFLFATGTPHGTPIVYGGPFVMSSDEQMHQARLRLGRGEMGALAPKRPE
jgi:quercetin 2,3-dioxygenase